MLIGKETKEKYLNGLTPEQVSLKNLANTIGDSYIKGIEDADARWRNALSEFLKKHNMPQRMMCEMYNYLEEL